MTAITRREPAAGLLTLRDAMSRLFEDSVVRPGFTFGGIAGAASFPINVSHAGDTLKVEALLPGVGPEDVDVNIDQGVLTIAAKRRGAEPREGERAYLREIVAGEFSRSFTLPAPVDAEQVTADFTNGVLTLTLPVAEEARPKRIPIGAGQPQPVASGAAS